MKRKIIRREKGDIVVGFLAILLVGVFGIAFAVGIGGSKKEKVQKPPSFADTQIEQCKKNIEVDEKLSKDALWRVVLDALYQKGFDMEVIDKEGGYIRTSWAYIATPSKHARSREQQVSGNYRSRITVRFLEDWRILLVSCDAQLLTKDGWITGCDTKILEDTYTYLKTQAGRVEN